MAATFQQLLKEFPKSAAAAQAHYYIGKAAFEAKDYETVIAEMNQARQLNKDQYGGPAALRILSSYFYLKQRNNLAKEVDKFYAAALKDRSRLKFSSGLGSILQRQRLCRRRQISHHAEQDRQRRRA